MNKKIEKGNIVEEISNEIKNIRGSLVEPLCSQYNQNYTDIFNKIAETGIFDDYDLDDVFGTFQDINDSINRINLHPEDKRRRDENLKTFAEILGKEMTKIYGEEDGDGKISEQLIEFAEDNDIVIATYEGYVGLVLNGAIKDSEECLFSDGEMYLTQCGIYALPDIEAIGELCRDHRDRKNSCIEVFTGLETEAGETIEWMFRTSIPHETFRVDINEDAYGEGIVFYKSDVSKSFESPAYYLHYPLQIEEITD